MPPKKKKQTLRDRLVSDGLAASAQEAEKLIRAGLVRIAGLCVDKPGTPVGDDATVAIVGRRDYVGRGALKLESAFKTFPVSPTGCICADVGVCTGGFTEVLLRRGATKVYAIDVGYGDLDWRIRSDARVVVMERTNARYLESLPDRIDLVTIDVSFISLELVLPAVCKWLRSGGSIIALIKPQFEAARGEIGEGGIVQDPLVHERVVGRIKDFIPSLGLEFCGVEPSPILGAEGNREFLLWARLSEEGAL